jgi:hypothetical protein
MRFRVLFLAALVSAFALAEVAGHRYEDGRIRLDALPGWSVGEVSDSHGAVLSKGRYRIYLLLADRDQSGIAGGRFGEIAPYVAPWMHVGDPWGCIGVFEREASPAGESLTRVDLYFDSGHPYGRAATECKNLRVFAQGPVWFGSYFTRRCSPGASESGCEGYFVTSRDDDLIFTVTLNGEDGSTLPKKGDPQLAKALREASEMAARLEFTRVRYTSKR